ncbi:hypothetical protein [Marinobacter sp.]|uniref:hypothetical protein n=1 Tax=Marinobacter sp. TaxID=50741 RepID=UPI00260FF0EB|nr:hypothetical protein [Marinobacter sp.]
MTQYVKVTLKEFMAIREAVDSNAVHAEGAVDEAYEEAIKAERAVRAIEKRNKIAQPNYS